MTHTVPGRSARRSNSVAMFGWRTERRGAAALEFALIAPIFFLLLLGIMELGRMFWMQVTLRQAVEQTARYAMAEYTRESFTQATSADFLTWFNGWIATSLIDQAGVETIAVDPGLIDFSQSSVTPATAIAPDYVTVKAEYTFGFLFPVIPGMSGITLTAESTAPLVGSKTTYTP